MSTNLTAVVLISQSVVYQPMGECPLSFHRPLSSTIMMLFIVFEKVNVLTNNSWTDPQEICLHFHSP